MCDISELAIWSPLARHGYEQTIITVDYTNVMYNELMVNRDRSDRFHPTVSVDAAESDISYLHLCSPPLYLSCCLVYNSTNAPKFLLHFTKFFSFL